MSVWISAYLLVGYPPPLSLYKGFLHSLLKVTDQVYNNNDSKKLSLLVYIDFSKDIIRVKHSILIEKCIKLNIDPIWIRDYLTNRSQAVRPKNAVSSLRNVSFGVPQGSVLCPIRFYFCVSLPGCSVVQYAVSWN